MIKRVSVVGLGKLGSPIAASFASRGYEAIGIDVNVAFVDALKTHHAPVAETDLQKLIDENKARIFATSDWNEAITRSDASFLVVPTPSDPDGSFSNQYVVSACEKLAEALREKQGYHLFAVVSTMMPGSSEREMIPVLERVSGKKVGKDFGYCYSPALIALGSVIHDFLNPDLVMIGESDPKAGGMLESFYRTVIGERPAIHRANPTEVELAKIALNTFVTTKISFANMLGMVAEGLGDVNVDRVTKMLGSDSRIGPKYLKAGGSYGGPCFPRDNRAFANMAERMGVETHIPQATDATNHRHITSLVQKIEGILAGDVGPVSIVGTAYKLDTDVVEEGMGILLASALAQKGIPVVIHDPLAMHTTRKVLGDSVEYAETLAECLKKSNVIVVTNPYKDLAASMVPELVKGKTIVDCWRTLPDNSLHPHAILISWGDRKAHTGGNAAGIVATNRANSAR